MWPSIRAECRFLVLCLEETRRVCGHVSSACRFWAISELARGVAWSGLEVNPRRSLADASGAQLSPDQRIGLLKPHKLDKQWGLGAVESQPKLCPRESVRHTVKNCSKPKRPRASSDQSWRLHLTDSGWTRRPTYAQLVSRLHGTRRTRHGRMDARLETEP